MPYKSFKLSDVYSGVNPPNIRKDSCSEPSEASRRTIPYVSMSTYELTNSKDALFSRRLNIKISYSVFHDILGWAMKDRFTFKVVAYAHYEAIMRIQIARTDSVFKLRPTAQGRQTAIRLSMVSTKLIRLIPQVIKVQRLPFVVDGKSLILTLPLWSY